MKYEGVETVGVELEPEWAHQHPRTIVGDSRLLAALFDDVKFDVVCTSPGYANRMSDHHDAKERCKECGATGKVGRKRCPKCDGKGFREYKRNTYKHYLGRDLTEGNSGAMQWGDEYRQLHVDVWGQLPGVMTEGGLFVLNVSNHIRKHEVVKVAEWHRKTILAMGCWNLEATRRVKTQRNRQGANHQARVPFEMVYAFRLVG